MGSKPAPNAEPAVQRPEHSTHTHSVLFYSDDRFLAESIGRFIGSALGAGDAAVVIGTVEHRQALEERLSSQGLDLPRAIEQGRYVALDARETMAKFMRDGRPDEQLFLRTIAPVIERAKAAAKHEDGKIALFGEMVALLFREGNAGAALRLEDLWNQLAQTHSFALVCAYPLREFQREESSAHFRRICDQHGAVLPDEAYTQASDDDRGRMVALWQQQAQVYAAEAEQRNETQMAAARLAAIVENSEDAIISKDLDGIVTSWNSAAERIFGWKAEEIIGQPILTIIPPELHGDESMILGRIRKGIPIEHFETVRLTKDGKRIDVSLTVSPVKDSSGRTIGAAKIARDITGRKRAEEALVRAEKLAATGRLAATIAHEINNPLEAVTNLLYLLRFEVHTAQGKAHLALAESELGRVSQITKQTLAFHRESVTPERIDSREMLDAAIAMYSRKIARKGIVITRDYQPCELVGMRGQLRQLFSNVIDNAIDASPDRGEIRIGIHCRGEQTEVSISDDGQGIAQQNLARLFEPFFTTKQVGTGLGLWVAKEIAEKHGGSIAVDSRTGESGHGTTFRVTLSTADANSAAGIPTAA